MDINDIEKLMRIAVECGVVNLEVPELKLTFQPSPKLNNINLHNVQLINDTTQVTEKFAPVNELTPNNVELSDEDMLFYSVVDKPAA